MMANKKKPTGATGSLMVVGDGHLVNGIHVSPDSLANAVGTAEAVDIHSLDNVLGGEFGDYNDVINFNDVTSTAQTTTSQSQRVLEQQAKVAEQQAVLAARLANVRVGLRAIQVQVRLARLIALLEPNEGTNVVGLSGWCRRDSC